MATISVAATASIGAIQRFRARLTAASSAEGGASRSSAVTVDMGLAWVMAGCVGGRCGSVGGRAAGRVARPVVLVPRGVGQGPVDQASLPLYFSSSAQASVPNFFCHSA